MDFVTIVWMLCCYLAWPLIEILITGERTVRHVDNVMSIVFLFAMAWSYTVGKVRAERKQEEQEKEKRQTSCSSWILRNPIQVPIQLTTISNLYPLARISYFYLD